MSSKLKKCVIILVFIALALMIFVIFNNRREESDNANIVVNFDSSIKIALLNGCGYKGVATEVKDYFIEQNIPMIDVISWKNVQSGKYIYDKTVIVVKKADTDKMKYLMSITGIPRKIIALNDDTIEEFQIILGKDYKQYFSE